MQAMSHFQTNIAVLVPRLYSLQKKRMFIFLKMEVFIDYSK